MRTRVVAAIAVGVLCPSIAAQSVGAQPTSGGCQAFGNNVAGLAQTLGAEFGATASSVASLFPTAFPTLVVHPEQAALC